MTSKKDCYIIILIKVATYTYDAWGNILSMSGDMAEVNPFRYRGYYYDTESGFYYLQTRYYDPTIRQFINADNYELLPTLSQTIGQLNLYAYANNNPVMFTDETGESFVFLALFLISFTLAGAGIGLGVGLSQGHEGWQLVGDVVLGAAIGTMTGCVAMILGGAGVAIFATDSAVKALAISYVSVSAAVYNIVGCIVAGIRILPFQLFSYDNLDKGKQNQEYHNTNNPYYIVGE